MRQARAQDFVSYRYFFWVRGERPFVAETEALQGILPLTRPRALICAPSRLNGAHPEIKL